MLSRLASGAFAATASTPLLSARAAAATTAGRAYVPPRREAPFSSPLSEERRKGRYHCSACGLALFDARAKYFTSTGWPTFSEPLPGAIRSLSLFDTGSAPVSCAICSRHLGEVFALSQPPACLRFSINGSALSFSPDPPGARNRPAD